MADGKLSGKAKIAGRDAKYVLKTRLKGLDLVKVTNQALKAAQRV